MSAESSTSLMTVIPNEIPDLSKLDVSPINVMSDYWTPENKGESKLLFFIEIKDSVYRDEESGEQVDLPCAFFMEQGGDGALKPIRNGSKRLVGLLESANIPAWTPFKIVYQGKRKNKNNSYLSDAWAVYPLVDKVQA